MSPFTTASNLAKEKHGAEENSSRSQRRTAEQTAKNGEGYISPASSSRNSSSINTDAEALRSPSTIFRSHPRTSGTPYLRRSSSAAKTKTNDADLAAASARRSSFFTTSRKNNDSSYRSSPWKDTTNDDNASMMAVLEPDTEFVADPFATETRDERRSPLLHCRDDGGGIGTPAHWKSDSDRENQAPTSTSRYQCDALEASATTGTLHSLCRTARCIADLQQRQQEQATPNLVTVETAAYADSQNRQTALHVLSQNRKLAKAIFGRSTAPPPPPQGHHHLPTTTTAYSASPSSSLHSAPPPPGLDRAASSGSHTTTGTASTTSGASMSLNSGNSGDSTAEEQLTHFVVNVLWRAYPAAMLTTDIYGQIPFEGALREWVNWTYETDSTSQQQQRSNSSRSLFSGGGPHSTILPNLWLAAPSIQTLKAAGNSVASRWAGYQNQRNSISTLNGPHGDSGNNNAVPDIEQGRQKQASRDRTFPRRVRITSHALYAVKMLSAMLETMESAAVSTNTKRRAKMTSRKRHNRRAQNRQTMLDDLHNITVQDMSASIVQSVASIPNLVKAILFIEDKEMRSQCLETTLMRRVLTSKYSVGSWLTGMLQCHEKRTSDLAIEYLCLVSDVSEDDCDSATAVDNSTARKPRMEKFLRGRAEARDDFHREVSRLQDFVPSLLSLGDEDIEDAATTRLVQQVLDQIISRPFVVTVVFCDAIFLFILIAGFRGAVNDLILGSSASSVLRYIYLSNVGLFYFLIREAGKAISLCMITRRARVYFWSFWNIVDLLTIVLTLMSMIAIRSFLAADATASTTSDNDATGLRNLAAITTGVFWLKVLNLVKGWNVQLATFIMAILQIARDILWFCFILFLLVVAAAQMFFTILAPEECKSTEMQENRECQQSEYYLKVYSIVLGDFGLFNRDSFTTAFSIVLACFFTFLVVLLVSNVIVAASIDSWDIIRIRSQKLFGRARIMMIAELVSFQNLLRRNFKEQEQSGEVPSWWSNDSWARGWSHGSLVFFFLSSGIILAWTTVECYGFENGNSFGNLLIRLAPVYVNVGLYLGIMVLLSKRVDSDQDSAEIQLTPWVSEWYGRYFQKTMVRLLGSSSGGETSDRGTEHQWQGRLLFLRNEMRSIVNETSLSYRKMEQSIDCRFLQTEALVLAEMTAIERHLYNLSKESHAMKMDLNTLKKDVLKAVESLESRHA